MKKNGKSFGRLKGSALGAAIKDTTSFSSQEKPEKFCHTELKGTDAYIFQFFPRNFGG
jgi:hypothetical protein